MEKIQCCNRKPKCNRMVSLTREDIRIRDMLPSGFVLSKLCKRHEDLVVSNPPCKECGYAGCKHQKGSKK